MPRGSLFTPEKLLAYAKLLGLLLVLTAIPVVAFRLPAVQAFIFEEAERVRSSGLVGIALYLGVCAVAGILVLPFWIPGVVAGFIFGFPNGGTLGFLGSLVAVATAFVSSRLFLRDRVARKLADNARWQRIEGAVRKQPRRIVFLLRALPILPQNLLGYALATTPVTFVDYMLGTVGLLPLVLAYSYLGSLAKNVNELFKATSDRSLFIGIGVMTALVLIVSSRFAARLLKDVLREDAPE